MVMVLRKMHKSRMSLVLPSSRVIPVVWMMEETTMAAAKKIWRRRVGAR